MGVCLNRDTPPGAWVVNQPILNATNQLHALFFGPDDYTTGRNAIEALTPALHSWFNNTH